MNISEKFGKLIQGHIHRMHQTPGWWVYLPRQSILSWDSEQDRLEAHIIQLMKEYMSDFSLRIWEVVF